MTASATEIAVLGGGCFWCLDAVFRDLEGVIDVESGYAGGSVANPSYEAVCSGRTGHAEVVKVTFDPARLDYAICCACSSRSTIPRRRTARATTSGRSTAR